MSFDNLKCATCGGELIQKDRLRLILVGAVMPELLVVAYFFPWLWAPAIILALTGAYLILWGTVGGGRWCRMCKRFGIG